MAAHDIERIGVGSVSMPGYQQMREEAAARKGIRRRLFVRSSAATQEGPPPQIPMTFEAAPPLPPFDWDWMRVLNGAPRAPVS